MASVVLLSDAERAFLQGGCRADCRVDGRGRLDFRSYSMETNVALPLCHGAARLWNDTDSATQLLATVKAELVQQTTTSASGEKGGVVEVHVQGRTATGPDKRLYERVQTTLRQLVAHEWVDWTQLQIGSESSATSQVTWKLAVDIMVLEASGGSLVDAASRVAVAALQSTRLPRVVLQDDSAGGAETETIAASGGTDRKSATANNLVVDGDWNKSVGVPLRNEGHVGIVTVAVLLDWDPATQRPLYSHIVDATAEEEACATALVHFCIRGGGGGSKTPHIAGLTMTTGGNTKQSLSQQQQHSGGGGALPFALLPEVTQTAEQVAEVAQQAFTTCRPLLTNTSAMTFDGTSGTRSYLLQEPFQWQPAE